MAGRFTKKECMAMSESRLKQLYADKDARLTQKLFIEVCGELGFSHGHLRTVIYRGDHPGRPIQLHKK